jgi:hypothetical protein
MMIQSAKFGCNKFKLPGGKKEGQEEKGIKS